MDRLQIEKVGGLAGFGGPHLKSRGEVSLSGLSPTDKQAVESLFSNKQKTARAPTGAADMHRYRITRQTDAGGEETVEVPEDAVPAALKDSVTDTLE
jgi:hypothetical protein